MLSVAVLRVGKSGRIQGERKERGISKQSGGKEEAGNDRQENVLSFSLSPSLPRSPTHSSKYNDHRKVISELSQSEDSEPTESHEKKTHRESFG